VATLEVSAWWFEHQKGETALAEMTEVFRESGIRPATVHAHFGAAYDFSALDASVARAAIDALRESLDLAAALGAPIVVVHASAEPVVPGERRKRLQQAQDGLAEIEEQCRETGRRIAVELLPRTCLGNTVEELLALLDSLDGQVFGVCLDTNHLMGRHRDLARSVRQLGDRLIALHLNDYDGVDEQHRLPGTGVLDWAAFMQALRDVDYGGPFNYECGLPGETPQQRLAALEGNYAWLSGL
jgi:hexosaminidase